MVQPDRRCRHDGIPESCAPVRDLQEAAAALAGPLEPPAVAEKLVDLACRYSSAAGAVVSVATEPRRFEVQAARGLPEESLAPYRRIDLDRVDPPLDGLLLGGEVWLESPEAIVGRFPEWADFPARTGTGAWAFIPLLSGQRRLGTLSLYWRQARAIDEIERSFLRALAQQGGFALDRARLVADFAEAVAFLDALFLAAPNGIGFIDTELRVRRANAALAAAAGARREDLLERRVVDLLGPDRGPAVEGLLSRILATGRPELDRELSVGEGEDRRSFVVSLYRVEAAGRPIGIGCLVRDVTLLRRAEEFRTHLLAIVGHDLRSPLAAITVSADMLLRRARDEKEAAPIRRIRSSADRIGRILRDLLDWARAEAGQALPLSPREASLDELCRIAADEAMAAAPGHRVVVEGEGEGTGCWDPDRLGQALGNLVGNAVKHGRPGAEVRVRWRGLGERVAIEVENEGEPIPREIRRHLFEPFRKGAATGAPGGGLGLGLFIARELVRAHGGRISVRSDQRATVFAVDLPRRTDTGAAPGT